MLAELMTTCLLVAKYYLCLTAPPDPRSRGASINREFLPRAQEPHIYWSRRTAVPRRVVATLLLVCNLCADGVRVCRCLIEQGGRCRPVQFRVEALVWPLSEGIRTRHCHLRHRVSPTEPGDRCESASLLFHTGEATMWCCKKLPPAPGPGAPCAGIIWGATPAPRVAASRNLQRHHLM